MAELLTLLLPDFLLIVIGYLVCRHTALNRPIWDGVERLVYYLLFPVLLFTSIVRNPQGPGELLPLAACGVGVVLLGIGLAYALRRFPGVDPKLHASGAQAAFRFNSYVALALSERLAGGQGLAWIGLIMSLCVPIVNVGAVWPLARHGGQGLARELGRNPLILATVGGLLFNTLGLRLPDLAMNTATRVGSAALPLGLMAVGAGLRLGALREGPGLAAALLTIRHLLLPVAGIALAVGLRLPLPQQLVVVAFAAMPTASSAYVLAVRMGGHGSYVAGLITISTVIGMAGLPLALAALQWVHQG
ncbi:MAG TPA: AEC family transporter [Rubrivivax sp.]|nr:AEC family transporter [Rubrivivax sp.]